MTILMFRALTELASNKGKNVWDKNNDYEQIFMFETHHRAIRVGIAALAYSNVKNVSAVSAPPIGIHVRK
jgi:hypothetical protein